MKLFYYYNNTHLPKTRFYHSLITLEFNLVLYQQIKINHKDGPKRFKILWAGSSEIENIIIQNWKASYNRDLKNNLHSTLEASWDLG